MRASAVQHSGSVVAAHRVLEHRLKVEHMDVVSLGHVESSWIRDPTHVTHTHLAGEFLALSYQESPKDVHLIHLQNRWEAISIIIQWGIVVINFNICISQ